MSENEESSNANSTKRGAGGTPGGVGEFFIGLALAGVGIYLLLQHVTVHSGAWSLFGFGGRSAFGLTLVPLLIGIGTLFFNGKSLLGWGLLVIGLLIIIAGIVASLHIYFAPTSLWNTLMMLGMLAAGLGLIAKSLRPHSK